MTLVTTAWPSILNGDEVDAPDLQGMGDAVRTLVANSISAIIGARAAMPMLNPLTVTAPGGMNILVGGTGGQSVYLDGASPVGARYVDNAPVQTIALASASTQLRNDLLCAQYNQTLTTVGTRNNKSTGGTISTVTSNVENESLVYQLVTGTPASSPVDPAVPSGYVAIARISVPASASTIVSGNIVILPPTMQSLILEPITANGFVDLVNNQTISGNKTFSGVTTIGGIEFASGDTPYSGVAGVRLNGVGSIIISPTATGNAIYLGYDCSTLASVNFGPTNAWGYVGSDGYHSPGNISVYGTDANVGGTAVVAGGVRIGSSASAISNAGDLYIARNASPTTAYVFYGTGGKFLGYDGSVMSTNAGFSSAGNGFFGGTLAVTGALTVGGATMINSYVSSDFSVNFAQTGQQLNITLPGGFISSHTSSDFSVNLTQTGRSLNLVLPGGFVNSAASSDSSVTITQTGRALNLVLPNGYVNSFSSSDSSVNSSVTGRGVNLTLPGGFIDSFVSDGSIGITQSGRQLTIESTFPAMRTQTRITASGSVTLTLPTLPGSSSHSWQLYASATADLGSGTTSMAGSGASWESSVSDFDDGVSGRQVLEFIGTAVGGQTPSATYTIGSLGGGGGGIFSLTAYPA